MSFPQDEINTRVFDLLEEMKQTGKIKSIRDFCLTHEIPVERIYYVKNKHTDKYKRLPMELFYHLSRDTGVSLNYLLFGVLPKYSKLKKAEHFPEHSELFKQENQS